MYVLGIESSCDETSAAVVENGKKVLSCEVSSSLDFHKKYGGIVPEIASRMQLETITHVVDSALKKSGVSLKKIGLIGVTDQPGLLGSLLVGISFAKAISKTLNVPLLEVNHLHSHIYASFLDGQGARLPFIALIVSGGHTSLFFVSSFKKIKLLAQTHDDACGEAFDKVAKILGLSYPGGPQIERLAKKGNPRKIKFGCSDTVSPLDFSFSGIKTAVLYCVQRDRYKTIRKADIAASFQEIVIDTLIKKSVLACKKYKINRIVVGGGVAANNRLREKFRQAAQLEKLQVCFPSKAFCMDNAAMVAGLAGALVSRKEA